VRERTKKIKKHFPNINSSAFGSFHIYLLSYHHQLLTLTMPLAILNLLKTPAPDDTSNKKRLLRDSLIELLATTIFVWAGTLSAVSTGDKLIALGVEEDVARILPIAISFGVSILALAYSIGHLTGGCMNPGGESFRRRVACLYCDIVALSVPKMNRQGEVL
jgi:hypothetical protein